MDPVQVSLGDLSVRHQSEVQMLELIPITTYRGYMKDPPTSTLSSNDDVSSATEDYVGPKSRSQTRDGIQDLRWTLLGGGLSWQAGLSHRRG